MAEKDFLQDRKKALEEQFFARENQKLLNDLKQKDEAKAHRDALIAASGIRNDSLLDHLIELDVSAETVAALSLVPLVVVAWADGVIQKKERAATLKAAEETGIQPYDTAFQLLETWLESRPGPDLLDTWKEYVGAFRGSAHDQVTHILREEIMGRAKAVAEAAGGFLGMGTVSPEEKKVLEDLEQAFA